MFNFMELAQRVLIDYETTVRWCQEKHLILASKTCTICDSKMNLEIRLHKPGKVLWRCSKPTPTPHKISASALEGTWFAPGTSKFGIQEILIFMYLFNVGVTDHENLIHETSADGRTSADRPTVDFWLSRCREICFEWVRKNVIIEGLIGGPNKTVEIGEMKIEQKMQNNYVKDDSMWLIAMIEYEGKGNKRRGKYRLEICPENQHDTAILVPLLQKHVAPGTTVMTDLWREHFGLKGKGFYVLSVNENREFVIPKTGDNVQAIESSWHYLKNMLIYEPQNAPLTKRLAEHIYRREVRLRENERFLHFVQCIATLYPPVV